MRGLRSSRAVPGQVTACLGVSQGCSDIQHHISQLWLSPSTFSEDASAQGLCQGELKPSQGSWGRDEQDPLEAFPVGLDGSGGVGVQVMNSQLTSPELLPTWAGHREAPDIFQLSVL